MKNEKAEKEKMAGKIEVINEGVNGIYFDLNAILCCAAALGAFR